MFFAYNECATNGHTAGAAATCTTAQVCTVCNEELVAALGHTPGEAATCTTAQACTVCKAVLAGPHTLEGETCTVCGKDVVLTLDEAYAKGIACTAVNAAGIQDKTYYYITITLDDQVNPNGFGRGTLVADQKYISVAGPYVIPIVEGSLVKGDTVVLCGQLGKVTSAKAKEGEFKGYEARLFNVVLVDIVE